MTDQLAIEATGETVGEAKWAALRELEKLEPGLDKSAVRFQVVSEGERGLLGVGYAPARVVATVDAGAPAPEPHDESELATEVRALVEPMIAVERKVVHLRLKEFPGVETSSEGTEPNRFVVITPV